MLVLTGALLVALTWGLLIVALALMGAPLSALCHRRALSWSDLRRGLWWGLTLFAIFGMLMSTVGPLDAPAVPLAVLCLVALGAAAIVLLIRRRGWHHGLAWTGATTAMLVLGVAVVGYLAVAALGPVTNFDSGLYHLTAISAAREFGAIPGLANLHAPLGYANASFPMAAVLGAGPWGSEGFRLLNGLVIGAVMADLLLRWANRRRTAGAYGLLVGSVVLAVPMVALSDYWVTSPSQDSAVFAATVAASALVMDAVAHQRGRNANLATALAASALLVLLRPTMGAYLLGVVVVAIILIRRGHEPIRSWGRPALLVAVLAVLAAAAQVMRDYLLSGWMLFPLSVLPFDVAWRSSDPVGLRTATLGYHRDPTDLWNAAEGWAWVGPWLGRLPGQWETWLLLALTLGTAAALIIAKRSGAMIRWRGMLLAALPSVLMVIVWWAATPPSFRFAWGPVFTALTIPIGWLLWRSTQAGKNPIGGRASALLAGSAAAIVLVVVAFSASVRLEVDSMVQEETWTLGVSVPYVITPVTEAQVRDVELARGLVVDVPIEGSACWDSSPLCTPEPDGQVGLADEARGLAEGLSRD